MIHVLLLIVVVGLALYLVNAHVPMQPAFKTVFNVVCVLALVLWLLQHFGVVNGPAW